MPKQKLPNAIIYDLEILKAIPGRHGYQTPGIEYCAGWDDHANMGISVLCAYDVAEELPLVYCADNLDKFKYVVDRADWMIGFNNRRFDNAVLRHNGLHVPEEKTVDLLAEIWKANGLDPNVFDFRTHGGLGLDPVCSVNFGAGKTGNGAVAPAEWQRGQTGKVISYCLSDVQLTFQLWRRIVACGQIINPKTGRELAISLPQFSEFQARLLIGM